ncbi:hypothetical protein FB451DRAFT_1473558 [Mycena latifolia]|nr:hypothetical protein FB451DRAFT_1473558 [Mycena latifolia]
MTGFRCAVPFYADPGQPNGPLPGQKIYLVSGRNVCFPGAYVSWPSAEAQWTGVSDASMMSYRHWEPLEAVWWAGCDRGEHDHSVLNDDAAGTLILWASPTPSLSTSPSSLSVSPPSPSLPSPSSLAASSPSQLPRSSSRTRSRRTPRKSSMVPALDKAPAAPATAHIAGRMAYAVKHNGGGVVFDDYGCARELYHTLQAEGESPSLASCPSLTEGVCFAEGFLLERASAARRRWIDEERVARRRNVAEKWATGLDDWRKRNGVWTSGSDDEWDG